MPHSWKAFDIAKEIVDRLVEAKIISNDILIARGLIQIYLEENWICVEMERNESDYYE